jgi:hypothetical protein
LSVELPLKITYFNGDLLAARTTANTVEVSYSSSSRAFAILDRVPKRVELDGEQVTPLFLEGNVLVLPRGQHVVTLHTAAAQISRR